MSYDEPEQVFDEAALGRAAREAIEFVEPQGWGQPPQLFGLVPTSLLATSQPDWADILDDGASLTVIEQEPLPGDPRGGSTELNHVLATTTWPDEIVGCALVLSGLCVENLASRSWRGGVRADRLDARAALALGLPALGLALMAAPIA